MARRRSGERRRCCCRLLLLGREPSSRLGLLRCALLLLLLLRILPPSAGSSSWSGRAWAVWFVERRFRGEDEMSDGKRDTHTRREETVSSQQAERGGRRRSLAASLRLLRVEAEEEFSFLAPRSVPNLAEGIEESSETTPGEYRGPLRCEEEGQSIRLAPLFSFEKALNVFSFEPLTHRHRVCLSLSALFLFAVARFARCVCVLSTRRCCCGHRRQERKRAATRES